jgi:hypothetical protein
MGESVELTEQEKLECTVKWLNRLWYGFVLGKPPEWACDACPHWDAKCKLKKRIACLENFKALELFTGEGTVAGWFIGSGL